ncbi:hypothetical protein M0812_20533 [Anaeramoeba flamelloides]|uniref:Uncharacterized protein n=1 Tax=Anaeramoeba flamelloides TaxID=1746091 RepID=A0AAV7YW36_9EUKA|nr:hypothetical protein M0812_20533 [Anaeramoeba flamelloides]
MININENNLKKNLTLFLENKELSNIENSENNTDIFNNNNNGDEDEIDKNKKELEDGESKLNINININKEKIKHQLKKIKKNKIVKKQLYYQLKFDQNQFKIYWLIEKLLYFYNHQKFNLIEKLKSGKTPPMIIIIKYLNDYNLFHEFNLNFLNQILKNIKFLFSFY